MDTGTSDTGTSDTGTSDTGTLHTPSIRHGYASGADGNRLHYIDFGGEGTPLVCMHGVVGNAWNFAEVAGGLTGGHRVLGLDFRGYGGSQWSSAGEYSTAIHAADLGALIDSLGVDTVDLMGSSWGALVGIEYAAQHQDAVGRLVVVDVEPSFEQSETDLFPMTRTFTDRDEVEAAVTGTYPNASRAMIELMAATCYGPVADGRLAPNHDPFFFERWPFRSDDQWANLELLDLPTLFVNGSDSFVRGEVMADMAGRAPNGTLATVSPSTHVIPVDNPAGLLDALAGFLD